MNYSLQNIGQNVNMAEKGILLSRAETATIRKVSCE